MRMALLTLMFFGWFYQAVAQKGSTAVEDKMQVLVDQFDKTFELTGKADRLTLIFIPGSNDPFGKIYDKHKGKKIVDHVQFIGGFREMMVGMDKNKKRKHLQEAFVYRYGKGHFPILLDLDGEIAQLLSINGYSIIQIQLKDHVIEDIKTFDFDRIAFFKALQQYFKP